MQAGNLVSSDVQAFTSRVLVAGVQREVVSWSVNRELSGDLPAQVVAASGITQATGSIVFAGEDVETTARNPWNKSTGWLPAEGDRVEIFAGDGVTEWKQFHGLIDRTTGSIGEGFQSTIIDEYDKLSAPFSHDALLRVMPPITDGAARRGVGLTTTYYADLALRSAGFYATPPSEFDSAVSVPAQGSMWPAHGSIITSGSYTAGEASHLSSWPVSWGHAAGNFNTVYSPRVSYPSTRPIQMTLMVAPESNGLIYLDLNFGLSNTVQLAVSTSRIAILRVNGIEACRVTLGAGTIVTALLKDGTVTLRTNTGGTASGSGVIGGSSLTTMVARGAPEARVAGINVSYPNASREFASLSWVPTAIPDYRSGSVQLWGLMDAGPAIEDTTCGDVLERISKATLSPMWIDETGMFRFAGSPWLRARLPVKTVTTLDDVTGLDWESGLLSSSSRVTVEGDIPAINLGLWRNRVAWRGSGGSLQSGDIDEQFIGPADDEDWVMLDSSLTILGTSNWDAYNDNWNSVAGVFYTSNGEVVSEAGLSVAVTLEKLGLRKYKLTHQAGTFPTGVTAELSTSPTSALLYPRNRDKSLPRLNARAIVSWADTKVTPAGVGGTGPELVHDAEFWVNRSNEPEILERIANYIQSQTTKPLPTITGLSIVPDPRLQLGDRITIASPDLMGISMNALIVGVDSSFGGSYEQSLTVRVTGVTSMFTTYAEFNDSGGTLTYAQWQALGPLPETYAEFNSSQAL